MTTLASTILRNDQRDPCCDPSTATRMCGGWFYKKAIQTAISYPPFSGRKRPQDFDLRRIPLIKAVPLKNEGNHGKKSSLKQ